MKIHLFKRTFAEYINIRQGTQMLLDFQQQVIIEAVENIQL